MSDCLIKQPAGLGDIIFCQKIASLLLKNDYKIWWPVIDEYYDTINQHMPRAGIEFCRLTSDYPMKELLFSGGRKPERDRETNDLFLPLQHADQHYVGGSALKAKYKIVNLDPQNWQEHFTFCRNQEREHRLFYDVLGLRDDMEYAFVNLWYGSPPSPFKKDIELSINCPVVEMSFLEGYTLFDWCKVLEDASQIFCVDTSLFYIVDMLELKATCLEAYSKFYPSNYMHIEGLFNKPWKYN